MFGLLVISIESQRGNICCTSWTMLVSKGPTEFMRLRPAGSPEFRCLFFCWKPSDLQRVVWKRFSLFKIKLRIWNLLKLSCTKPMKPWTFLQSRACLFGGGKKKKSDFSSVGWGSRWSRNPPPSVCCTSGRRYSEEGRANERKKRESVGGQKVRKSGKKNTWKEGVKCAERCRKRKRNEAVKGDNDVKSRGEMNDWN